MRKTKRETLHILIIFTLIILITNVFIVIVSSQDALDDQIIKVADIKNIAGDLSSTASATGTVLKDENKKIETEENIGGFVGIEKNEQIVAKGVDLSRVGGKTTVNFRQGGYVKIKTSDGKEIAYSELQKLDGVKKDGKEITMEPQITLNEKGEVIGAAFTTGADGEYIFGDQKVSLKKGTRVYFDKDSNKVNLGVSEDSQLTAPTKVDVKDPAKKDLIFSYQASGKGNLNLNGYKFSGASLNYQNGNWFFEDKEVKIDDSLIARRTSSGIRTYLDFNGKASKDYQGSYISMNKNDKTIVIGTNTNDDSPAVMFTANNPYGIFMESGDHFAFKVLGDGKASYAMISDKDRSSKGFIPEMKIVGSVAVNEDNAAVGTLLKDGNFYKKINGVFIEEFKEFAGKGVVPVDISAYKLNEKGEEIPVSISKISVAGKQQDYPNKFVISNKGEIGVGPNPMWIAGNAYDKDYPLLTRGVSNRVSYNYIQYTKAGFEKYTGLKLSMDSYAASKMTPGKYRMLIDFSNTLTPLNKKYLEEIEIVADAGDGAIAWGGPGGIRIQADNLDPNTLRHEATHAITLGRSGFQNAWESVGGGSVAFTSGYGRTVSKDGHNYEDVAEYGGEFIYKSSAYTSQYLTGGNGKYYRGKMAVMLKYDIIDRGTFNYHFANAGLATDDASIQKYINEAKR